MVLDPALIAVAGALSTVAAVLYRELVKSRDEAREEADFWREKALLYLGMTDLATDEAERRKGPE